MINKAESRKVSTLFDLESNKTYNIPRYQREYTWSKDNWEALFNDIFENPNHFIGSIIIIPDKHNDAHGVYQCEVVDGQQRLTTISILFNAIYSYLNDRKEDFDVEGLVGLINLEHTIVNKKDKSSKLVLSSQNHNNSDYRYVLQQNKLIEEYETPRNAGNRKITRAFRYFQKRIAELHAADVSQLLDNIKNAVMVEIIVDSHSDAFILFESLNNRGVPLSAVDLIKNKLLAVVSTQEGEASIDEAFRRWKKLISNLTDEYTIQERFLRQYYNTFKVAETVRVERQPKATRSNLIKIYETLIDRDYALFFEDLYGKSEVYSKLIGAKTESEELNSRLLRLSRIKAAPAYMLLMYLWDKVEEDTLEDVLDFLIKYFVRRNVVDFPNTRNLDQIFMNLIERLANQAQIQYSDVASYLLLPSHVARVEDFEKSLNQDVYEDNPEATRFLLTELEAFHTNNRETNRDFWERDKSKNFVWTIEHVLPKGKNLPAAWVTMIADGDPELASEIQHNYVHKLGNLTLTGYNQNLSNFEFSKKRDRSRDGKYIGYKNGLYLNRELQAKEAWKKEDISRRTGELVAELIDLFKFKDE